MIRERIRVSHGEGYHDDAITPNGAASNPSPLNPTVEENDQDGMKGFHRRVTANIARLRQSRQLMRALKASILLVWFHGVSSRFDSISLPTVKGMQRRLSAWEQKPDTSFRQPRVLQLDYDRSFQAVKSLVDLDEYPKSDHEIYFSSQQRTAKKDLQNSERYNHWQRDRLREGDCEPMQPWQETSFPSCNKWHEVRIEEALAVLTEGGYNQIYTMKDIDGSTYIAKILKYERDYTDRNFDRVRRDSLLMERATSSEYVVNTYSYCGFSQVIEYGQGGSLDDFLYYNRKHLSQEQKLQIATQVTQALHDMHNLDGDGISSMSHGDFMTRQYIFVNGRFKLSDFNRGRFIRWNKKLQEPCPYTIGHNGDTFRAPEEYVKRGPQTAAIDVWALGSIFVEVVSGYPVWAGYKKEVAREAIIKGIRPPYRKLVKNPSDPVNKVLFKAINMCWVREPKDRPTPGVVLEFLKNESAKLGIQWDQPFILTRD